MSVKISIKRAKQIARNIDAFDYYYGRSDDHRVYKLHSKLQTTLIDIISKLSDEEKKLVKSYSKNEFNANYFKI